MLAARAAVNLRTQVLSHVLDRLQPTVQAIWTEHTPGYRGC